MNVVSKDLAFGDSKWGVGRLRPRSFVIEVFCPRLA
jgi:hypothetical protein